MLSNLINHKSKIPKFCIKLHNISQIVVTWRKNQNLNYISDKMVSVLQ